MNSNVYVDDEDIKVSKSSFSIYEDEFTEYIGKKVKIRINDLIIILQKRRDIMDALGYEILQTINKLKFATSRQITEYLNYCRNIPVEQSKICKKLEIFSRYSIISKYTFCSNIAPEGTNMKFYTIDRSGSILLKSRNFKCDWKPTDLLNVDNAKLFLIRNQYYIKLNKEYPEIDDIKIKQLTNGIGLIYSINNVSHVVIPVRKYADNENTLVKTIENIELDADIISSTNSNRKIIIIGEDVDHIFNLYKTLGNNKMISPNIIFITDLKLYENNLSNSFVRFLLKKDAETNKINVTMPDAILEEFKK